MAVLETRSHWGDLIKGISAKFAEVFDQAPDMYDSAADKLFKFNSDDASRMRHTGKTPAGTLTSFGEGADMPATSRQKTYDTEYIHTKFGNSIEATMEELEDRDWNGILEEMKDLVISDKVTRDENLAEVLVRGFDTNAGTNGLNITRYGDAVPLFSTIHPRKDGGSAQSNASATGIVLDADNLDVALVALQEQLNDDGTPTNSEGKFVLVVPPKLTRLAIQITQSELDANTANNNINYYKGVIADVVSIKWLGAVHGGSDTAWYVVMPQRSKLFFVNRKGATPSRSVDDKNFSVLFGVVARWSCGHSDWRYTWGSKGDGASYAS